MSEEVLLDAVETLKVELNQGSVRSKRRVLKTFVQKIEVLEKTGTLYYTFPLHALALPQPVCIGSTPGGVLPIYTLELVFG